PVGPHGAVGAGGPRGHRRTGRVRLARGTRRRNVGPAYAAGATCGTSVRTTSCQPDERVHPVSSRTVVVAQTSSVHGTSAGSADGSGGVHVVRHDVPWASCSPGVVRTSRCASARRAWAV